MTITNNATVTIPGGRWLNVDFRQSLPAHPARFCSADPAGLHALLVPGSHTFLNNTDGTFGY